MASGRIRVKQETRTRTRMELTNVGMCGKTSDPVSVPLASSSSQGSNMVDTTHGSTEHGSLEYEDVKRSSPCFNMPYKNNNTVYPKIRDKADHHQAHKKGTENINSMECWKESNKDLLALKVTLGIILVVSFTSLVLVVLDVVGVIGSQCVCNGDLESKKEYKDNLQSNASTVFLMKRIDVLEKNISSLTRQIMETKYGVNDGNATSEGNQNTGNDVKGDNVGNVGNVGNKNNSSSSSNITTEVKKLREKQVQLDSSLTKLKKSDQSKTIAIQEMSAKVLRIAVAVKFLSLNDSLIKSKVHKLSQAEVEFRLSLEALKQKDAEVDTSMKRAKGVEAFLNSSVNQLKSIDGQIKTKMDQLDTKFMTKINSMNRTVSTMQGGGGAGLPGPPGPQGPRGIPGTPGAGNLSQCQHQQKVSYGTSGPMADYYVNFIEAKDKIVLGTTCSTERGDETFLSSSINSQGQKVYLCTCRGQSNYARGSGNLNCLIDVWVCPRIS